MTGTVIHAVRLTPTHDGDAALVVELRFAGGGRSTVQIEADGVRAVMLKAGVDNAMDLVGQPWTVLDVNRPTFVGSNGQEEQR